MVELPGVAKRRAFLSHPENVAQHIYPCFYDGPNEGVNSDDQSDCQENAKVAHHLRFGGPNGNDVRMWLNSPVMSPQRIMISIATKLCKVAHKGNSERRRSQYA